MSTATESLAIHGGKPARSKPLPPNYPGALMMGEEEIEAVARVIRAHSPFRFYGPDLQGSVLTLEKMMAADLGVPYVLGVTSGTAALMVALKAIGIGYGDKVVVPAVTFLATATAVVCSNAVPVYADVDASLNLDPEKLESVLDDEVKAIIAVPIVGVPCDMDAIMAIARKRGIKVIEDVAQSCGVMLRGKFCGTFGDVGTFSFQMNKILTAGEGGAIVTSSPAFYERAERFHDQGQFRVALQEQNGITSDEETSAIAGQNYRMSEITGAVMVEQWKKWDRIVVPMRERYRQIKAGLAAGVPGLAFRGTPDPQGDVGCTLGLLMPSQEIAADFMKATAAENIGTYTLYGGRPVYRNPALWHMRSGERNNFPYNYPFKTPVTCAEGMCPRAEDLLPRSVFVSVSPILTDQDVEEVIYGITKVALALGI